MHLKDLGAAVSFLTQIATLNKTIVKAESERLVIEGALTANSATMASSIVAAIPWIAGIAAAIGLVTVAVKAYKAAHPSLETLQKDAEAAKNEFNEMEQKVKDTSEKIEELNKLKEQNLLTSAESKELEYLERQNEIYTAQRDLLKEIADYKEQQAKDKANDEASKQLRAFLSNSDFIVDNEGSWFSLQHRNDYKIDNFNSAIDSYIAAKSNLDSLNQQLIDSGLEAKEESKQLSEEEAKALQETRDNIEAANKELTKQKNTLIGYKEALVGILGDLTDEEAIAQVESLLDMISDTGAFDDFTKDADSFDKEFKKLSTDTQKALYAVAKGENNLIDNSGKLTKEGAEFVELLDKTGVSAEDAAIYLTRWAGELSDTTITGPSIDTSNVIGDLATLRDELAQTKAAIEKYNKFMEGGEKGSQNESFRSAWKSAMDLRKKGKVDTRAMRGAATLMLSDEKLKELDYDLGKIGKFLNGDMFKSIFGKKDSDMGKNFANYLKDNASKYKKFVDIIDNGNGSFSVAISSFEGLAKKMGISTSFLYSLLDGMDAFGKEVMDMFPFLLLSRAVEEAKNKIHMKAAKSKLPSGVTKTLVEYANSSKSCDGIRIIRVK